MPVRATSTKLQQLKDAPYYYYIPFIEQQIRDTKDKEVMAMYESIMNETSGKFPKRLENQMKMFLDPSTSLSTIYGTSLPPASPKQNLFTPNVTLAKRALSPPRPKKFTLPKHKPTKIQPQQGVAKTRKKEKTLTRTPTTIFSLSTLPTQKQVKSKLYQYVTQIIGGSTRKKKKRRRTCKKQKNQKKHQ
jgi:hypothetical protein